MKNRITEFRETLGLTVKEVCEAAKISIPNYHLLRRGETVPKYTTACRLARALNVDVKLLFIFKE